ncbi:MAG: DUF3267 domain-containing protein [Clostridia bacterium]|nr:DUF3267 domain-containing protein [Clostridia bacterium]
MKALHTLPENYRQIFSVDLQKDTKLALLINVFALLIAAVLVVPMHFYIPISTLFDMEKGLGAYILRFGVLLLALVAYMVLHELVHGITMKLCGTKKVRYGFTGLYAFAGSEDYYDKRSYIAIALAPVVVWGVVLAVVNALVSAEWFWVVYLIQIGNLSGAAGDLYVTVKFSKFPKDLLVQDSGVSMTVYSASVAEE